MDIRLDARWIRDNHELLYHLEVYAVGKWRPMAIRARTKRTLTKKDLMIVSKTVAVNTNGEVNVVELRRI